MSVWKTVNLIIYISLHLQNSTSVPRAENVKLSRQKIINLPKINYLFSLYLETKCNENQLQKKKKRKAKIKISKFQLLKKPIKFVRWCPRCSKNAKRVVSLERQIHWKDLQLGKVPKKQTKWAQQKKKKKMHIFLSEARKYTKLWSETNRKCDAKLRNIARAWNGLRSFLPAFLIFHFLFIWKWGFHEIFWDLYRNEHIL